jgi:hypothetical protein
MDRLVVAALIVTGCGGQVCHGTFLSNTTDGGTATLANTTRSLAQPTFLWTETGSPAAQNHASFQFQYDNADGSYAGSIDCPSLTWSTVSGPTQPVALVSLGCEVDIDADVATITSGTMTVQSTLDAHGNGTITIQIDIPKTTFGDIQVEVVAMKASATFGDQQCGSSCSGINPVI